jgi:hypothetical protein
VARVCLLLAAAAIALVARIASADSCPSSTPELAAVDSQVRLRFLEETFDREIHNVDLWSWTWGTVYAAGAVAQASIIPTTSDHGLRTDLAVGSISAGGGSLLLFGLPLQITLPMRGVRRQWDDADRCALLARAEAVLETGAKNQRLSNGVVPHIGNVLVNAGIALILGLGYGRWQSAAISAGVGVAIGEANAFTQPHRLPSAFEKYRKGELAGSAPAAVTWSVVPWTNGAWGASATLAF